MNKDSDNPVSTPRYPRLEKFFTNLGWLFASLFLVGGGNYIWYKFAPDYGPDDALIAASCMLGVVATLTILAVILTRSSAVAKEGISTVLIASIISGTIGFISTSTVYGRYQGARALAEYATKFINEHCALQACSKTDDAGEIDIDALQKIVVEQQAIETAAELIASVNDAVQKLSDTVVDSNDKLALNNSVASISDDLKSRKRPDLTLLRDVVFYSPYVCQTVGKPAVGAHAPGGVVKPDPSAKTWLVCHPQAMLDYGKSLPAAYPLNTFVLEKLGYLPVQ